MLRPYLLIAVAAALSGACTTDHPMEATGAPPRLSANLVSDGLVPVISAPQLIDGLVLDKVNDAGQISGLGQMGAPIIYAAGVLTPGGVQPAPTAIDLQSRSVFPLNNASQVLGLQAGRFARAQNGTVTPYVYDDTLVSGPTIGPHGYDLNDQGTAAVSFLHVPTQQVTAALLTPDGPVWLPSYFTGPYTYTDPLGLNNVGTVVGYGRSSTANAGLVWRNGSVSVLPSPTPSVPGNFPVAVNDQDEIVGLGWAPSGGYWATVWRGDVPKILPVLPNGYPQIGSGAADINQAGDIVGSVDFVPPSGIMTRRAVLWHDDLPYELPVPAGTFRSYAFSLNDLGMIVGRVQTTTSLFSTRAAIWTVQYVPPEGATPAGSNVSVTPTPDGTGPAPVTLTFSTVTGGGVTSLTSSSQGAPAPLGFKLGRPPVYYDLRTTATFTGPVTVCVSYAGTTFGNPATLRLFHGLAGGTWEDVTTSHTPSTQTICGSVSSLSPFVLAESALAFGGLRPPVDPAPTVNTSKAGQTVPVKFSLGGAFGLEVFAPGYPRVLTAACSSTAPVDAIEETMAASQSGLTFDAQAGLYTYAWRTEKTWAGTCRSLRLRFRDGVEVPAEFRFSK